MLASLAQYNRFFSPFLLSPFWSVAVFTRHLLHNASVQLATSPVLVGPACQMTYMYAGSYADCKVQQSLHVTFYCTVTINIESKGNL